MGQNKILPFDTNRQNLLSDAQYQSDSDRLNGNISGQIARSELVNKALTQTSAVANAIGQIASTGSAPDATDDNVSNIITGLYHNMKRIHNATLSIASDNTWNITVENLPNITTTYAILTSVEMSSVDNQPISINGGAPMTLRRTSTANVMAGDVVATPQNPFIIEIGITGGRAYLLNLSTLPGTAITGIVPITNGGTGATTAFGARANLGAAAKLDFNNIIITTNWTGENPAQQVITVNGITPSDRPIVSPVYSDAAGSNETNKAIREAWSSVSRIVTGNNQITVYCFEEVTTTSIPIQMQVVR